MRASQSYGITEEARKFLEENALRKDQCLHCHRHDGYVTELLHRTGMFNDVDILRYRLTDDRFADMFEQRCHWWSGPMLWFGLKVWTPTGETIERGGKTVKLLEMVQEFLWDEEEIEKEIYRVRSL
jgi:hypothetical protein